MKIGVKDGKLIAAGGELMAVPDAGPCCLCFGCGEPETHFVMTPPTCTATLDGLAVNPDEEDVFCPLLPDYRLPPGCEECAAYNDTYELPRGDILTQPDPHPDPTNMCIWSDEFNPNCTTTATFNCEFIADETAEMVLRVLVFLTLVRNLAGECEVRLQAQVHLFYVGAFGITDACDYGDADGSGDPIVLHTFPLDGTECLWKLSGSFTLTGQTVCGQQSHCTWTGTTLEIDFG